MFFIIFSAGEEGMEERPGMFNLFSNSGTHSCVTCTDMLVFFEEALTQKDLFLIYKQQQQKGQQKKHKKNHKSSLLFSLKLTLKVYSVNL